MNEKIKILKGFIPTLISQNKSLPIGGTIKIILAKTLLFPGEKIDGEIELNFIRETMFDEIRINLKSIELIQNSDKSNKPQIVLDQKLWSQKVNQKLKIAEYRIPFSFVLPQKLRPSYCQKANEKIENGEDEDGEDYEQKKESLALMHIIECKIESSYNTIAEMSDMNIIKIRSIPKQKSINKSSSQTIKNLFGVFGYKQTVCLNRNEFNIGETIPIMVSFENQGQQLLKRIKMKLIKQQYLVNSEDDVIKNLKNKCISEKRIPFIVPPKETKNDELVQFEIPDNPNLVLPTYKGKTQNYRYILQLVFCFSGKYCTELKVAEQIPIKIISRYDRCIKHEV